MSLPERHQHPTAAASPLSSSRQSVRGTTTPAHPAHPAHLAEEDSRHQYQLHQDQNHQVDDTASQKYETGPFPSEPQATAQPRHSQFQPFFTLVEDANTGESHHPTVHYIFSDDDTDILTEAAVRSLEQEQQEIDNQAGAATRRAGKKDQRQEHRRDTRDKPREEDSYHEENDSILPPPIPGVRDNYLILDVEPTVLDPLQQQKQDADPNHPGAAGGGAKSVSSSPATQPTSLAPPQQQQQQQQQPSPRFTVTTAHSLTPAWQVLNTELVPAPTFENNASSNDQQDQIQPQPLNGGLMLKIHGTPGHPPNILTKDKDNERGNQRLEDMMDQFAKRMSELQRVIEAGDIPAGPGFDAASASRTGLDGEDQEQGHWNLLQEDTGDEPAS